MKFNHILFSDIETVPAHKNFADLGEIEADLFRKKFRSKIDEKLKLIDVAVPAAHMPTVLEAVYQENAALCSEFCKIVSTGFGYILGEDASAELRIKVNVSGDEQWLLAQAADLMGHKVFTKLCGHNFENFDGPMMGRRSIINHVRLPDLLHTFGKKPWEMPWIDTMKWWAMGEYNYKCSLERMCFALGIETPKGEMDGSMVKDFFYGETPGKEDLPFGKFGKESDRFADIRKYQGGDIVALVNGFLRLNGEAIIPPNRIVYA